MAMTAPRRYPRRRLAVLPSWLVSALMAAGVTVLLASDRVAPGEASRATLAGLAAGLGLLAIAARICRFVRSGRSAIEGVLLCLMLVAAGAALAIATFPLAGAALLLAACLPLALVEMSVFSMARAPRIERGRARAALLAGLGVAAAVVTAFAAVYVASARDRWIDLSWFRTSRPGTVTRKTVRALSEPVEVFAFFPAGSEVGEEVMSYLGELGRESPLLEVARLDRAVDPERAAELEVLDNGTVHCRRGGLREEFYLELELERARRQLRDLDRAMQRCLFGTTRPPRVVYMTTGHGERSLGQRLRDAGGRAPIRELADLLRDQGYVLNSLSGASGLAAQVPADAAALLVVGPLRPFLPAEIAAVQGYLSRGGRLLIALDAEPGLDGAGLLEPLGLAFHPVLLASDINFASRTRQAADRLNMLVPAAARHPAIETLSHLAARAPVLLPSTGWLESRPAPPDGVAVQLTLYSDASGFDDRNRNLAFDSSSERRGPRAVAAAVEADAGAGGFRAIVLADSDALADEALGFGGNPYLLLDGLKWLSGDEALAGPIASELDRPIAQTRQEERAWFHGTILGAPALVLIIGAALTWARRARREVVA